MKRGLETTKPKKLFNLGRVEFTLVSDDRKIPESAIALDGYYEGIIVVTMCQKRTTLVNARVKMTSKNMVSCAPYFVYAIPCGFMDDDTSTIVVEDKLPCPIVHMKPSLTTADLIYMAEETLIPSLVSLAKRLVAAAPQAIPSLQLRDAPFSMRGGLLYEVSDAHRLPHLSMLYTYLGYDVKLHKKLSEIRTDALLNIVVTLKTQPWELVWRSSFHKGLLQKAYVRALADFGAKPPAHIGFAIIIYYKMVDSRNEEKHTIFRRSTYNSVIPCMRLEERQLLERQVYEYLTSKDVVLVGAAGDFQMMALEYDHHAAVSACDSLQAIHANSRTLREPERRGLVVPQKPPTLTVRQTSIAQHILNNWFTIVEGLPGTGKTALITWVFSHYCNVMMTSFVGMMVKSLQKRNGRRKEAACTIHHLLALKKYAVDTDAVDEWLARFQVLVVDEFSNVSMSLFYKLLALLPNVSKIVLVGDHRQLKPIDCGDPMGDLLGIFSSHELLDNLRVKAGLQPLQEAPGLIAKGEANRITFDRNGPISFVKKEGLKVDDVLGPIFASIVAGTGGGGGGGKGKKTMSVLDVHIVVLTNKARKDVNRACERVWNRMGIVKIPPAWRGGGAASVQVRHNLNLYVACKITFSQNYNTITDKSFDAGGGKKISCHSDPVANGELAIIIAIEELPKPAEGIMMRIVDTEDKNDCPETKSVWLHPKYGVHPKHVDLGYATTTYRTQGREFPYVIFWNQTNPDKHWTRPNAYVAISRGKERVWVACEPADFFTVCGQKDVKRKTIFAELLGKRLSDVTYKMPVPYKPASDVLDPKTLKEDRMFKCVPLLTDVVKEIEKE